MKKLTTILAAVLITAISWAQSPQKMSYQAVIRNASNTLVTNTTVGMQISILQGTSSGAAVYIETQTPTTNANGLVSIAVGAGTVVNGAFGTIDWSAGPYFIKTETDPTGGTTYTITGTSQLLSVPYALYAKTATTSSNSWGITGNTGTTAGTNYIGTIDNKDLIFKRNNTQAGLIGSTNTAFGAYALNPATTGSYNTANGTSALASNTTGNYNTANGLGALYSNTTGNNNTANGYEALASNSTGYNNSANGYQALNSNTTGDYNTANGYQALYTNSTGYNNTANGGGALFTNSTGVDNTANGAYALYFNTGNNNTANGEGALYANTTGIDNTANGEQALYTNSTGNNNTANGFDALSTNSTGNNNTANGYEALALNFTGYDNTANGEQALFDNTTGYDNSVNGAYALYTNSIGNNNTANGYKALYFTTGDGNTAIGNGALYANTTGIDNTALGYNAGKTGNYTNSTAIGYNAQNTASNQVHIGNTGVTSIGGQVGWTTLSDKRFKKDIKENVVGLNFIMKLKPVTYHLNIDALNKYFKTPAGLQNKEAELNRGKQLQTGFVAQDVLKAAKASGINFSGVDAPKNAKDYYGLRYAQFVVPLVKGMQEQQKEIDALKKLVHKFLQRKILVSN